MSVTTLAARAYSRVIHSYRVQGLCQSVVGVETSEKVAAITFDDGPDPRWTPTILETLERHGARGTFFVLGRNVAREPELARRIMAGGHVLGNHTNSHPRLADLSPREVTGELGACRKAIESATNTIPRLMRPPYGAQRVETYVTCRALGYRVIHWSAGGEDWKGDAAEVVAGRVLNGLTPGAIVLLHDGLQPKPGEAPDERHSRLADRTPTIEALETILETAGRDGFRFVTVPELLTLGPARRERWFWT